MILRILAVIALLALAALPKALGEPPSGANPDSEVGRWFKSLKRIDKDGSEYGCCDLSDCRFVSTRIGPQGYEALIDRENYGIKDEVAWLTKFGTLDPQWVPVPNDRILQGKENPYGRAAACWSLWSDVICFVRPAEI